MDSSGLQKTNTVEYVLGPLRDADVRTPLRALVRQRFPDDSIFLEELVIPERDTRIDMAVVNGALHGFEIKSDADTIRRLPVQRESYNALFDEITLVVGKRHLKEAQGMIPEWWGLAIASRIDDHVEIERQREASANPHSDPATVIKLLRRPEIEAAVRNMELSSRVSQYYMYELHKMVVAATDAEALGNIVRAAMKQRYGRLSALRHMSDDG
jgi:hypothetical protein